MALTDKTQLRKEFLTQRNQLDEALRSRHSSLIRQRIFQHPSWSNATLILCYVSFGSEVETHALIQEALRFKKRIAVPIHDGKTHGTPLTEITRFSDLTQSHRGILQADPQLYRMIDPATVELALIPGIAFDKTGGRLGFGGGYFDKLLPQMKLAKRMALSFEAQIASQTLPHESHDMLMDMIVTEKAVHTPATPR